MWSEFLKSEFEAELKFLEKDKKKLNFYKATGKEAGYQAEGNVIWVKKENVTHFLITHEMFHAEERKLLGFEKYIKGSKASGGSPFDDAIRTYKRERYVFEKLMAQQQKLSPAEIKYSRDYINSIIEDLRAKGIDLTKI